MPSTQRTRGALRTGVDPKRSAHRNPARALDRSGGACHFTDTAGRRSWGMACYFHNNRLVRVVTAGGAVIASAGGVASCSEFMGSCSGRNGAWGAEGLRGRGPLRSAPPALAFRPLENTLSPNEPSAHMLSEHRAVLASLRFAMVWLDVAEDPANVWHRQGNMGVRGTSFNL